MSTAGKLGWRLSLFLGGLYFVTLPFQPYPGSAAIKGLSIATLALIAWLAEGRLLALALAASSIGDVLLDVDPQSLFVPGLAAFLVAHLLYTALFVQHRHREISKPRRLAAGTTVLYAAGFALWLSANLGPLSIPVGFYILVITAMVVSAVCAEAPRIVPTGAILFLISDSILAAGKFKTAIPLSAPLVWGSYYAAQFLITKGMIGVIKRQE